MDRNTTEEVLNGPVTDLTAALPETCLTRDMPDESPPLTGIKVGFKGQTNSIFAMRPVYQTCHICHEPAR